MLAPMVRTFFHIDIDAFFASVEQLDDPSLRGKPVIVGARPGGRGVVSTCSYEARAFGVRSAMPIGEAVRRCPGGVFIPVRMERYNELAERVMETLRTFSPDFEQVSIDEAVLEMTGTERLWGPPRQAAVRVMAGVSERTGLSISVGVASNRYAAKVASGLRKPGGLVLVEPGTEAEFMRGLPLERLWGAGEKTRERLMLHGFRDIASIASAGERRLRHVFGEAGGTFLHLTSRGEDPGIRAAGGGTKSMSGERTFPVDIADRAELARQLRTLADDLAFRMWRAGLEPRTVTVKLRYADFSTVTRSASADAPYPSAKAMYDASLDLLVPLLGQDSRIRLLGLGFSGFREDGDCAQGDLFESGGGRERCAEEAVFGIERRGLGRIVRAGTLDSPGGRRERPGSPGKRPQHGRPGGDDVREG